MKRRVSRIMVNVGVPLYGAFDRGAAGIALKIDTGVGGVMGVSGDKR